MKLCLNYNELKSNATQFLSLTSLSIIESESLLVDFQNTVFLGYSPKGENIEVIMPVKKPKELTKNQKEGDTQIARVRVKVEHVMAGIKRLRII